MKLILASSSPRRQELLKRLNQPFTVSTADIDESRLPSEAATDYINRMVANKAQAVLQNKQTMMQLQGSDALILTADTIGVLQNGDVLLKPTNKDNAFTMWQNMAGTHHQVWTAVQATLINRLGEQVWSEQILEMTKVYFTDLTNSEMEDYWNSGEPTDKAGGYAIQGLASAWVEKIEGSYTNVVGLPLSQTKALISKAKQYTS